LNSSTIIADGIWSDNLSELGPWSYIQIIFAIVSSRAIVVKVTIPFKLLLGTFLTNLTHSMTAYSASATFGILQQAFFQHESNVFLYFLYCV